MLFYTHLAFAFLIGLLSLPHVQNSNPIIFMMIILFAGILPDIDHAGSKIGRYFKIIGWLFEHRGFFHSAIGTILFTFTVYFISNNISYSIAFLLGYSAHIFADMLTDSGVMFFHPFSKRRFAGFFKTGGLFEHIFLFITIISSLIYLVLLH